MKLEYNIKDLRNITLRAIDYYTKEYEKDLNEDKAAEQSINFKTEELKKNASIWRRWRWRNKEYKYEMLACKELGYYYWCHGIDDYRVYEYKPKASKHKVEKWMNILHMLDITITEYVWLTDEEFFPYAEVKRLTGY